ncbi:hypothetical protein C2I36_00775 [Rhodobacteraceae bacterium WD3A24]|nr:hypothetical protein C2I36_00775 [Rhodobacteraceae bacterium WD3A24]
MLDRSKDRLGQGGHGAGARESLKSIAAQYLASAILGCEISPGSFVTEAGIAAAVGLGKAPVRAALASLSERGLVEPVPRHGYRVAPVSAADLADLYDLRLRLEPGLCEAVSMRDVSELARLDRMLVAASDSPDPSARRLAQQADADSLRLMAAAAGNRRVEETLMDAAALCQRALIHVERCAGQCRGIIPRSEIVATLEAGDAGRAAELTRRRLEALSFDALKGLAAAERAAVQPLAPRRAAEINRPAMPSADNAASRDGEANNRRV